MIAFNCKDCPDRHEACHDTCERYQQAKAEAREIKHRQDLDNLRVTAKRMRKR